MRVAIVGGGYSGTIAAVEVARAVAGAEVALIDKGARFGAGAAYSTTEPGHLLNVRARDMSALADAPDHFAKWAARKGYGPDDYVPRRDYGRYLQELLAAAPVRLVTNEAVAIDGHAVRLASGERLDFDKAVLAGGNYPGKLPEVLRGLEAALIDDPWSRSGTAAVEALAVGAGDVLLLGTGLTMVDMAITLAEAGFKGRMIATSRRGLVPRAHVRPAADPLPFAPAAGLTELLRAARRRQPWRAAVDSMRQHSQSIWRGLSESEKRRFLRHLRPWWDVHRHRIAPPVAARIEGLREKRQLKVAAGRIARAEGTEVTIARRRGGELRCRVSGVVNCTGPEGDISRVEDPLIRQLLASGTARADGLRLGLEVDQSSRVIGADGTASLSLHAVGPLGKGMFWEIVAVPDIRHQLRGLAQAIAG